jgi:hypothetical protein
MPFVSVAPNWTDYAGGRSGFVTLLNPLKRKSAPRAETTRETMDFHQPR